MFNISRIYGLQMWHCGALFIALFIAFCDFAPPWVSIAVNSSRCVHFIRMHSAGIRIYANSPVVLHESVFVSHFQVLKLSKYLFVWQLIFYLRIDMPYSRELINTILNTTLVLANYNIISKKNETKLSKWIYTNSINWNNCELWNKSAHLINY